MNPKDKFKVPSLALSLSHWPTANTHTCFHITSFHSIFFQNNYPSTHLLYGLMFGYWNVIEAD